MPYSRDEILGTSELRMRGWRDSLIRVLLGSPDVFFRMRGRALVPVRRRLWLRARVVVAEATEEFMARRKAKRNRSTSRGTD